MILAWRQQSKAAAQAHDNSRQADFLSRDTCLKRIKGSTGLTRRELYGNRPPFFPSLTPLCIEWREKETRPEHTWGMKGMKGMLVRRHCYWIAWCSRQGSERAHGWYMSSLLLFYAFDYTLLFLTMDRYPFVDLALLTTSLHWIRVWMCGCVCCPPLLARTSVGSSIYVHMMG